MSDVHTASSSNDVEWNMNEEWITEAEVRQRFPAAADASRILQNAKQYECMTMGRLFAIPKYTSSQQMRTSSQFKEQTKRELKGQVQGSPIAKRQRRAWGCRRSTVIIINKALETKHAEVYKRIHEKIHERLHNEHCTTFQPA